MSAAERAGSSPSSLRTSDESGAQLGVADLDRHQRVLERREQLVGARRRLARLLDDPATPCAAARSLRSRTCGRQPVALREAACVRFARP